MPTQENERVRCDCGNLMRYRRRTKEYVCMVCPKTIPLSSLTPTQPVAGESDAQ